MKILMIVVSLMIICSSVFAQDISSFRKLSSGGALLDNLDLILDPLDIRYVSGIRLYTNLSNLWEEDKLFMDEGANHFLMAISSDQLFIEGFRAALITSYHDNKYPNLITFYPDPSLENLETAWGEIDHIWQGYEDTTNNGLYDTYRLLRQRYQSSDYESGNEFYLNLSYQLREEHALGWKIGRYVSKEGHNYLSNDMMGFEAGTPSFHYHFQEFYLPENDPTAPILDFEYEAIGNFDNEREERGFINHFAYAFHPNNIEYRLGLVLESIGKSQVIEDMIEVIDYFEFESNIQDREISGWYYALNAGLRYTFMQMPERKNDGYLSLKMQIGSHRLDNEVFQEKYYEQEIIDEGHSLEENIFIRDILTENGTVSSTDFSARARLSYPLNERTYFGSGFYYHYTDIDTENDFFQGYSSIDSLFTYPEKDWLEARHITSSMMGISRHQERVNIISIPVGVEYWFTNNMQWALRLGSRFTQRIDSYNSLYQPTYSEPEITYIYFHDEEEPIILYDDNTYIIESENQKVRTSQTVYTYGIGYKPNENLQIDLMGMFDQNDVDIWNTNFFRNLRLSVSFMF